MYIGLFVDYKISCDTVFLSFKLKDLILIIKHNGKVNFHLYDIIIYIPFIYSSSAKLRTRFSWKENSKKCTSFEEQKGTRYIRGNVYFQQSFSYKNVSRISFKGKRK